MNVTTKMLTIAGKVLEAAAEHDSKIEVFEGRIKAWARAFQIAGNVWEAEALEAVDLHYATSRFPLTAADVIEFCANCAPGSSADHANDFLDYWCDYPYSEAIEEVSGIAPPTFSSGDGLTLNERRAYLVKQLTAWVNENRERLVAAILERAWKPEDE